MSEPNERWPQEDFNDLIDALVEAGKDYAQGDKLWARQAALEAALKYLGTLGVPQELQTPLIDSVMHTLDEAILGEWRKKGARGPKPRPVRRRARWAQSAAAVTALVSRKHTVTVAISKVSKTTGIDAKRLRNLRDNISRGHVDGFIKSHYEGCVAKYAGMTEPEVMKHLDGTVRSWGAW
jgi:hypothetical protein